MIFFTGVECSGVGQQFTFISSQGWEKGLFILERPALMLSIQLPLKFACVRSVKRR